MTIVIYIIIKLCAMKPKIKFPHITAMTLLILILPACMYALTPLSAQSDDSSGDGGSSGDGSSGDGSSGDGSSGDGSSGDGSSSDGSSSSSSASQDYQEFQSCLSGAEVDGSVSEQQIRDCFAPIYNTGTTTELVQLQVILLQGLKVHPTLLQAERMMLIILVVRQQ